MSPTHDIGFDAASAISIGRREYQEDAVAVDFPSGSGIGFAVVSDGMGGHAAGDVASKIVVTEVFSELKLRSGNIEAMEADLEKILRGAVFSANECVRYHAETYPGTEGMGATLLAPIFFGNRMYWISIGDSPLYLFRDGQLQRLNEDHSLVPQIDYLVRTGFMGADEGLAHPDRHCLTSVLVGQPIPQIDCRTEPFQLQLNDIVIAASDGLQFLEEAALAEVLSERAGASSAEINGELMARIEKLADPDQDNVSLCIIKAVEAVAQQASARAEPHQNASDVPPPRRHRRKSVTVMAAMTRARATISARVKSEGSALS
ncbi:MAG: PP2C family serine/threonine-protein phosphatase [Paracoccaceae bacterium]